ncbi:MAG: hypothetical protein CMG62_07395 [Candidatus Marinimicrobia bacterium]|nr:hypothetical protein [Candidatus Neomarinimicrobiota bacterium]
MRTDLITRFDDLFNGGFRYLIDNGVFFTNNSHEHGYTSTAPGHFVIATGKNPGPEGVIGNSFYDRRIKKKVNSVQDDDAIALGGDGKARSYSRYSVKTIGDWMKLKDSNSKVYSIAGKDRSAVLLGGMNPNLVIYYNYKDSFISSNYYCSKVPNWLDEYNNNLELDSYSDSLWKRSFDDDLYLKYSREDNFLGETDNYNDNIYSPVFPIGFKPNNSPGEYIMGRPWFEKIILDLALLVVSEESLGLDSSPDLLCIGFSAIDWIVHDYGPFSQEAMDAILKLDQYIGDFIQILDNKIGLNNIEFILTSDHGGLALPEYREKLNLPSGRVDQDELMEALQWIDDEIIEFYEEGLYFRDQLDYYFDLELLKEENINPTVLKKIIKKYLLRVKGIENVFSKSEILSSSYDDQIMVRMRNSIHPDLSPDVFGILSPGYLIRSNYGTNHGTPYDYDTKVPLIFSKKGRQKKEIIEKTKTIDIAPSIANLLGIKITDSVDGKILKF